MIPTTLIGAVVGLSTLKKASSTSSQGEKSTSNQNSQVSKSQSTSKNSQSIVKSVFSTLVGGLIGGLSSIIGLKIKSEIDKPAVVKQKDEILSELTKINDDITKTESNLTETESKRTEIERELAEAKNKLPEIDSKLLESFSELKEFDKSNHLKSKSLYDLERTIYNSLNNAKSGTFELFHCVNTNSEPYRCTERPLEENYWKNYYSTEERELALEKMEEVVDKMQENLKENDKIHAILSDDLDGITIKEYVYRL